jgi:hypothetical protein
LVNREVTNDCTALPSSYRVTVSVPQGGGSYISIASGKSHIRVSMTLKKGAAMLSTKCFPCLNGTFRKPPLGDQLGAYFTGEINFNAIMEVKDSSGRTNGEDLGPYSK